MAQLSIMSSVSLRADRERSLDRATLEALYVKLEKPMFNVVYRWLWNAGDARDVVQDAFLRVWNARDRVELATIEPLLYRTALNLASNRRRTAKLWKWIDFDRAEDVPARTRNADDALLGEETRAKVKAAIDALPAKLREVVLLAEYTDMTQPEIGAALGIPSGTVASRRNAAVAKLQAALGEWS